jgi:outer membrane protein assembly factor BamD
VSLPSPRIALLAALVGLGAALPACGGAQPAPSGALHYAEDAKRAYDQAMVAFGDKDWEEAIALFNEVKRKYSYSRWARMAELRIADAQWQSEKVAESIQTYRSFVHDHRTDDEVPYARYRIVKGLFGQISDTVMLPPAEERDQATTFEAYKELRSFVHDYPHGKYAAEAAYMLASVTGRLVRHELYVARFYLKKDNFEAAVARAQYALRNYDGSGLEPEAMVLLGETYLKMKKPTDARQTFSQVLAKYPESAFAVTAKSFLAFMDKEAK